MTNEHPSLGVASAEPTSGGEVVDADATLPQGVAMLPGSDLAHLRRLGWIRRLIAVLLVVITVSIAVGLFQQPMTLLGLLQGGLVIALGITLLIHQWTVVGLADRRIARDASVTRILQGLSRSVSPESVVDAIVQELRSASGADHVVVARIQHPDQVVEVTLVAASAAVPTSRTYLRPDVVGELSTERAPKQDAARARPTARGAQLASQGAADEIARRVRAAYGLPYTLAAPLVADNRFLGALMLSKRTRESWSDNDRRLLAWAAAEVAAAFARAYSFEAAERGANIDALTGLPNRRYFEELLAIMRPRRRQGDSMGVLMVDIDHFKRVNDRFGHATGDTVLRAVAGAIAATVRAEDTPARYGGEEFAVILRRASTGQAADVAERIRQAVAAIPPDRVGIDSPVTVSVGVAVAAEADTEVRPLVERADRALYLAKRRGRDRMEMG